MLSVSLIVDQLKLNHMHNIINDIAPSYLKSELSIAGHTGQETQSGNTDRGCFVTSVNSFAVKCFFYTGIKQWNAHPSATQLISRSNKQTFKLEIKKLLWTKLIQVDEEIYPFFIQVLNKLYCYIFLLILYLFCTIVQLYSDLTILTLHTTPCICDIKP